MSENLYENILAELKENRTKFRVDHFDIILLEYLRKYEEGNLILDPPYQRTFRWNEKDQSTLIESIILGIPLPPFFVFQRDDGRWELIDGLQRTTTLTRFTSKDSFKLKDLEILKTLNNKTLWELPPAIKLRLENYRVRIEIVEETKDIFSQYLLFKRLNSNGEKLEAQEKRNFLIYKQNPEFYEKIQKLASNKYFIDTLNWDNLEKRVLSAGDEQLEKSIRTKKIEKQENVEYLIKFILARYFVKYNIPTKEYRDISSLIDDQIIKYLNFMTKDSLANEYSVFVKTFKSLYSLLGDSTLKLNNKKVNNIANRFTVTCGLSFLFENNFKLTRETLIEKIHEYYTSNEFKKYTKSSYSPTKRIFELNKFSYNFFCGD